MGDCEFLLGSIKIVIVSSLCNILSELNRTKGEIKKFITAERLLHCTWCYTQKLTVGQETHYVAFVTK